jgi:hypothetical protein
MKRPTRIRAFTLAETLVAMLLTGILLLTVMEGLTLFFQLEIRQTEALLASGRAREGYYRLERLVAASDSIAEDRNEAATLHIWRGGRAAHLMLRNSALLYADGHFRDTLLRDAAALRLTVRRPGADTMEIVFGAGFAARFPVMPSVRERHEQALDKLEKEYGYDEE